MDNELIDKYYKALLECKYDCVRTQNYEIAALLRGIENTYFRIESDDYKGFNEEFFLKSIQKESHKFKEFKILLRDINLTNLLD